MISCKIIYKRDPNTLKITDKIQAVKAPNGKRSLLFDSIRNQINDDTKALTQYFKVYTNEFKEDFGDWEQGLISDKLDQNGEPKYEEVKDLFIDEEVEEGIVNTFDDDTTIVEFDKELGKQLEAKMKKLYPKIKLQYTNEAIANVSDPDTFNQLIENDYFDGNKYKYITEVEKVSSLIENKLKYKLRGFHGKYNDNMTSKTDYLNAVLHDLLFNIGIYNVHSLDSLREKLSSGEVRKNVQAEYKAMVKKRDINAEKLNDFYFTKRLLNSYLKNQQIDKYDNDQQKIIKEHLPQLFGKLGRYKSVKQAIGHLKIKINGQRKKVDGKWIQPNPKDTQLAKKLGLKFTEKNFLTSNSKAKKFETLLNYFKIAQHDANTRIYNVVENELNRREEFFDGAKIQGLIAVKEAELKAEREVAAEARERRREYELNKYKNSNVVETVEGLLGGKNIHDLDEMLESNNIDVELAIIKNNGYPLSKTSTGKDSILYDSIMTLPEVEDNKEIADKIKSLIYSDNFTNWFGEWQDSNSDSSKIVDKNGEPKLVYHGSGREFDHFNEANRGDTTGKWEDRMSDSEMSFMFTDSNSVAFFYAIMERQGTLNSVLHLISNFVHKQNQKNLNAIYEAIPSVKNWVESLKDNGLSSSDIIAEFRKIKDQYEVISGLIDPRYVGNPNRYFNDIKESIKFLIKNKESLMKDGVTPTGKYRTFRFDTAIKKGTFLESVSGGNISTSISDNGTLNRFKNQVLNGKNIKDLTDDEYELMVSEFKENYIKGRNKVNDQLKAGGFNPKIYPVFLNVRNPNKKDFKGRPFTGTLENGAAGLEVADLVQEAYESDSLDGSIIENISDPENAINYSVFESNQIKSLFNKGTYDNNPNFYNQIKDGNITGQANIKAMTVLINNIHQKQDTLPHEYAHHYIAWFRNTPMVQEGIKRFGSEEALVQAIGEQVVKQKGEAYNWWKKFVKWILSKLSDKQVLQILTDSFLQNKNINHKFGYDQEALISSSDKIIYGHPGIGKTTALKANKGQFIDWDVEFNKKRDKWIEDKSNSKKGSPAYKRARTKYLVNYKDNPDYISFVTKEWNRVKAKANQTGKKLLASPHILLDLFPNDFDKVINIPDSTFIERNVNRGEGSEKNSRSWKEGINNTMSKISPSKIVTTDKYLSEILPSSDSEVDDDVQYSLMATPVQHKDQPIYKYIGEIFEDPEFSEIGTKQDYSNYLSTIFPNSEIKDVVYRVDERHGLDEQDTVDDYTRIYVNGVFYSTEINYASNYNYGAFDGDGEIYHTLVDIQAPMYAEDKYQVQDLGRDKETFKRINEDNPRDSIIFDNNVFKTKDIYGEVGKEIVIFEPEQIHILGSDKDIQGFKDYMSEKNEDQPKLYSLSASPHQGQPQTKSKNKDSVAIDVDSFRINVSDDGYTDTQIKILETYNKQTQSLTGRIIKVEVSKLPPKLRKVFELKGEEYAEVYETIDETGKKGYVVYRVSNIQDLKKVKGQSKNVATAQEQSPKSVISRQRGTEMHDINENLLNFFSTSNDAVYNPTSLRNADVNLWSIDALESFKKTDKYKELKDIAMDIFLTKQKTNMHHDTWSTHSAELQLDKLAMSMLHLYHQVQMTQQEINRLSGKDNKPIFILEKPFLDKGKDVAGTMDIFVVFSDGTASIYDHKFTDLRATKKHFKSPSVEQKAEIDRIRKAQGLPVNANSNWYFQLPDNIDLYKKEESWNAQIGRYAEMAKQLYGVKSIRQARILPVATTYTKVDSGRKNKDGDTIMHVGPGSKVEVILTGVEDDYGVSQIALNIERTGDTKLDRFIDMLIKTKESLKKEMATKQSWGDPKYVNRIKGLDESIQALLKSRDITHISDAIGALANQIENDLNNVENPITFEQIITHFRDIEMFDTFMELSIDEIDKLEDEHEGKEDEENPYITFRNRLNAAKYKLSRQSTYMQDKLTVMIGELNKEGGFMSDSLFKSFTKQRDMNTAEVYGTHLRESNHPIVSLFSQLLDGVETNVMKERNILQNKLKKIDKELSEWGTRKGLSGVKIYKDIIDDKHGNLIRKFTNYKKDLFPDYSDQNNHKKNIAWFKEHFERVGVKEEIFQNRFKKLKEYWKRESKGDEKLYKEEINKWLNNNDINHNGGDNKAWYNLYVQHLLTPKNPSEYYTEEYEKLLKPDNKPLLDFYTLWINQMNMLSKKADFQIYENSIPEVRKDSMDILVQDGIFGGVKQQFNNIKNWWTENDNDDGMKVIMDEDGLERSVPIFYQNKIGDDNKSFDLSKSLMLFSDFVHKYNGIKDIEYASLAMRKLLSKTAGVRSKITGEVLRNEAGDMLIKEGSDASNKNLIKAFDTWIGYYIYGEKKKDNEKVNKIVDAITSLSSRKAVALNHLSALGGHINAEAQLQMIAKKTTYFTTDTLSKARKKVKLGLSSLRNAKEANEGMHSKVIFSSLFFEMSQEDMSHEKANSMSLSKLRSSKFGTQDYAYVLQRVSDDIIDNTTTTAMMMDYGIDPITGKTYPLSRLKKLYENNESEFKPGVRFKDIKFKSIWDMIIMKDGTVDLGNGDTKDIKLDNSPIVLNQFTGKPISDKTFTDFRRKGRQMIARTKGNMSADDIAGYRTHAIGRLIMQFRGWIPATVRERFKGEQYNLTMEQMEVGRLIAAKNMLGKNLKRTIGKFVKEIIPFMSADFGDGKTMSDVLGEQSPLETRYKQFIADNPHLRPDPANPSPEQVSYEDYFNAHIAEIRALAKEVQLYLALAIMLGVWSMAGGDDELNTNPLFRYPAALLDRAMLEIGFFVPIAGTSEQIQLFTRAPAASISLFSDVGKLVSNTFTETFDLFNGADWDETLVPTLGKKSWSLNYAPRKDKVTLGYYTKQWMPPVKFMDSIIGFTNTTKRDDTWFDYITTNWEITRL